MAQNIMNGTDNSQLMQQNYKQQLHQQQQHYATRDGPGYNPRTVANDVTPNSGATLSKDPILNADKMTQEKRVQEILMTDTGANALLLKLKQSTHSCRDYAGFLKKIAMLTEEHAAGLRKVCKLSHDASHKDEGRQGTYLVAFQNVNRINERIADNESVFSTALLSMHEDLMELVNNTERSRKHWKQISTNSEKRGPEAHQLMMKTKAKYDSLAEEFERSRSGKSNKTFSFSGARSQHDEELRRKVEMADADYMRQVTNVNQIQGEQFKVTRPQTIKALQDLVKECDAGLTLQMQRFGALNEMLLVKNATAVSPMPSTNGEVEAVGMREMLDGVDNDKDLRDFILGFNSKVPANIQHNEVKYEKNPAYIHALQQVQQPIIPQGSSPLQGPHSNMQQQVPQAQLQQFPPGQQNTSQFLPQGERSLNPPSNNPNVYVAPGVGQQQQQQQFPQHFRPEDQGNFPQQMGNLPNQQGYKGGPPQQALPELPRLRPVFGVALEELLARDGNAVPTVVIQCMTAVDLFGLNLEGIYRLAGANTHVQRIKNIFDNDPSNVDFRNPEDFFHDVNSVASALKLFFRELPDPLLTRELYPEFVEAAKIQDESNRRDTLHALINRLPDAHYATIRALVLHLNRVQQNSATNKMTPANLAISFGPTLMGDENIKDTNWQNRVLDTILKYALEIFDDD